MKRVMVYALATLQILVTSAKDMEQNQNLSQEYLKAKQVLLQRRGLRFEESTILSEPAEFTA